MTELEIRNIIKEELAKVATIPVGAIIAFPSTKIPNGYLPCEGQELSKLQYPELFNLLGYTFGGERNTFLLPDLQGKFIRGLDREGNIDIEENGETRSVGSIQYDALQGHRHLADETSYCGSHSHKIYVDSKNPITYGTNTISANTTKNIHRITPPSVYRESKDSSAYDFTYSTDSDTNGNHSHKISVMEACNGSFGIVRVDSETRPVNIALIYCIKVK